MQFLSTHFIVILYFSYSCLVSRLAASCPDRDRLRPCPVDVKKLRQHLPMQGDVKDKPQRRAAVCKKAASAAPLHGRPFARKIRILWVW